MMSSFWDDCGEMHRLCQFGISLYRGELRSELSPSRISRHRNKPPCSWPACRHVLPDAGPTVGVPIPSTRSKDVVRTLDEQTSEIDVAGLVMPSCGSRSPDRQRATGLREKPFDLIHSSNSVGSWLLANIHDYRGRCSSMQRASHSQLHP